MPKGVGEVCVNRFLLACSLYNRTAPLTVFAPSARPVCSFTMNTNERTDEPFLPANSTAIRLGIPVTWLKREAKAGHIPCLRVGNRILFNLALVERTLLERAANGEVSPA